MPMSCFSDLCSCSSAAFLGGWGCGKTTWGNREDMGLGGLCNGARGGFRHGGGKAVLLEAMGPWPSGVHVAVMSVLLACRPQQQQQQPQQPDPQQQQQRQQQQQETIETATAATHDEAAAAAAAATAPCSCHA